METPDSSLSPTASTFVSRRQALCGLAATAGAFSSLDWIAGVSALAAEGDGPGAYPNRFPRMVHEYYVTQVTRAERRGLAKKAELKTKADAEAYVKAVQERIRRSFAPFPKTKTPLNARVTGTLDRDVYTVEKVIFESRPNFLVTANLYIPKNRKFPLPGVVGTCGHSTNGKAAETYQSFSQGLARQGYVVLIYDPIGQGERLQFTDDKLQPTMGTGTREHNQAGNHQYLVGEFFGTWRAWDGIRALDYLLTRKEVDPKHVGVTGNSGGGTMTTWLCGVEPRWTMAAASCFVTTWRHNMENELPQDVEQCPPRSLAMNLDHDDYLATMAPKPVIILPQQNDYFDVRGSEETFERLKHLYRLLGAEENIQLAAGPATHGYSIENRESMYRWFNQVTKVSDATKEPELTMEADADLYCTPEGQIAGLKSRPIHSFTAAKAKTLAKQRTALKGEVLETAVRDVLHLPEVKDAPRARILRFSGKSPGYPSEYHINYAVETEPGILALVTMLTGERWYGRPPQVKPGTRALLYIPHQSSDLDLRNEPLVRELIAAEPEGTTVFACDPRGVGESTPGTTQSAPWSYYGSDYFYTSYSFMLNRPYLGGKTHDVLRVVEWLASNGYDEIHLAGRGWGALPAAFASLLSKNVKQATLKQSLTSYHEVATTPTYTWPLSTFLPGVLKSFDLPDIYAALESRKLRQVAPLGATEQPEA